MTSASAWDGAQLSKVVVPGNTGSTVVGRHRLSFGRRTRRGWRINGYRSDIHHKKPKGRPMSEATSRANGRRSKTRATIEHVFRRTKRP